MMLSLSAINMLLFSVIAFSYANLFNIVTYTLWNVNNEQSLYRKKVTTALLLSHFNFWKLNKFRQQSLMIKYLITLADFLPQKFPQNKR